MPNSAIRVRYADRSHRVIRDWVIGALPADFVVICATIPRSIAIACLNNAGSSTQIFVTAFNCGTVGFDIPSLGPP